MKNINPDASVTSLLNEFPQNKIYIVGGYVRDYFLKLKTNDIDLVTPLSLDEFLPIIQNISKKYYVVDHYQTVMFGYKGYKATITRLRKDIFCDGRQAQVKFVQNIEEDVSRRDFTINAIYLSQSLEVIDFVNGLIDLKNKNIRFIGNPVVRIKEDVIRILRYVRFCSLFDTPMNQEVLEISLPFIASLKKIPRDKLNYEIKKIKKMPFGDSNLKKFKATTHFVFE